MHLYNEITLRNATKGRFLAYLEFLLLALFLGSYKVPQQGTTMETMGQP